MGRVASLEARQGDESSRKSAEPARSGKAGKARGKVPTAPKTRDARSSGIEEKDAARASEAPPADAPKPRVENNATVREILPWHVVERKIAARDSGHHEIPSANDEAAPEPESPVPASGVRTSESFAGPLTYKVYTLADLDRDAPASRAGASMVQVPARPSHWPVVARAAKHYFAAARAWRKMPKIERPPFGVAVKEPRGVFYAELKTALSLVNWRKVGTYAAAGIGTAFVLLFVVITAAELTDDLKPAAAGRDPGPSAEPRLSSSMGGVTLTPPPVVQSSTNLVPIEPAALAEPPVMELGADPPVPPATRPVIEAPPVVFTEGTKPAARPTAAAVAAPAAKTGKGKAGKGGGTPKGAAAITAEVFTP